MAATWILDQNLAIATPMGPDRSPYLSSGQGQQFINLHDSYTLPRLHYSFNLATQSAFDVWDFNPSTSARYESKSLYFSSQFDFSLGLFDGYQMGFTIPTLMAFPNSTFTQSVIDPRLGPLTFQWNGKFHLFQTSLRGSPLGMAFIHSFDAPFDDGGPRLGSFIPSFNFELATDWTFPRFAIGVNFGYKVREPLSPKAPQEYVLNDFIYFGAGVTYLIPKQTMGVTAELQAATEVSRPFEREYHSPQELFLGAWKLLPQDLSVYGGVGFNFAKAIATSRFRLVIGLSWVISPNRIQTELENSHRHQLNSSLAQAIAKKTQEIRYELPIAHIPFKMNQRGLAETQQRLLELVTTTLKEFPQIQRVTIRGHTDNTRSLEASHKLAEERARAISVYLIERGVPESILHYEGVGFDENRGDNRRIESRMENRRVELIIQLSAQ